jgi:hypothetical protein
MRRQRQTLLIAPVGVLVFSCLTGCSAGIVALSKDTSTIYQRADERLKANHEALKGTVAGLAITEKASRRIQLRWERAVEIAELEQRFDTLILSARSDEDKQRLRQQAVLRIAALKEQYSERIAALDSKVNDVDAEMAQLVTSHEVLVKLQAEILKNHEEIQRCLEPPVMDIFKKAIKLDFSPVKDQCFIDLGRTEQLVKEGRELVEELRKIREKKESEVK